MNIKSVILKGFVSFILMISMIASSFAIPAYAKEDHKIVRVGYFENEIFQEGAGEGLVKTGYAYEYYRKLSEYTGWEYEYVYAGFSELYQMFLDGEIDMLAGLAKNEERESIIGYPNMAMGSETYNIVKHSNDDSITTTYSTLNGKKIGVLDSAMVGVLNTFLADNSISATVSKYPDYQSMLNAFDSNAVDAIVAESDGAYGRDNAELLYAFGSSDYYLCVTKSRKDLLDELNSAQERLMVEEPNYINSLSIKYYSSSISSRTLSKSEKAWLNSHDTLKVGYLNNYLPYSDTDENGKVTGIVSELLTKMFEELGIVSINITYKGYDNYDEMIKDMTSGNIDLVFPVGGGLYYSEQNGIYQSNSVESTATELVYKDEYTDKTESHFAVNENNRMQYYYVTTYYPNAQISYFSSIEECLEAVNTNKVTATTLNGLRATEIIKSNKYDSLSLRQLNHMDDRCFGVEIGNEGLLKLINRGISIVGEDYLVNLPYRYTDSLFVYTTMDFIRDHTIPIAVFLFIASCIILVYFVENNRRKKKEMEEKITLSDQLIEQQKRREDQDRMITAMASDYRCVYHVDLDKDDAVCYREDPSDPEQSKEGVHFNYHDRFKWYAENRVDEGYRKEFLEFIDPDNIRAALAQNSLISYRYLAKRQGEEYYEMIRVAGVRHPEDRDDHIVHAIGLGLTDIDSEVRESMAKNQMLSEALASAEEANKAKTAFLSNMSHEIRTPMNAIIGLDSLALRDDTLPDETKEYLEKIGESAKHLLGLINDILDMSRIESGRIIIRREEFSFRSMLEQINTMVMSQCSEKGLKYECKVTGGVSDFYIGDDMKLKQVLINILSNAIKFTEAPGSVTLEVEKVADYENQTTIKFIIKDTGIGISQEFLPKIFDTFTQENSDRNSKYGSTGLGMAITKSIVDIMNGTISVSSQKGVGTEFTVNITLRNCEHQMLSDSYIDLNDMYVLVVDDEEVAAEHARLVLNEVGIRTDICFNGAQALDMLEIRHTKHDPYNLVLLDWKMPDMDGIQTASHIRELYDKETTIIILTSFNWDEIMDDALHAGVDSFLAKPLFASNVIDEFDRIARKNNMSLYKEKKRADLKGKNILIAEDVEINAEIMKEILSLKEAYADHALNGSMVLEMFENSKVGYYDAILMDVRMPEMDGLEATERIRHLDRPDASTIPIIAMTANAFDEDVQRSLQVGMNAHLSKPVEPEKLYQTMEELIWEYRNE